MQSIFTDANTVTVVEEKEAAIEYVEAELAMMTHRHTEGAAELVVVQVGRCERETGDRVKGERRRTTGENENVRERIRKQLFFFSPALGIAICSICVGLIKTGTNVILNAPANKKSMGNIYGSFLLKNLHRRGVISASFFSLRMWRGWVGMNHLSLPVFPNPTHITLSPIRISVVVP